MWDWAWDTCTQAGATQTLLKRQRVFEIHSLISNQVDSSRYEFIKSVTLSFVFFFSAVTSLWSRGHPSSSTTIAYYCKFCSSSILWFVGIATLDLHYIWPEAHMIDMKWENGLLGFVSMFVLPPAGHKGLYFFVCFIDLMVKQTSPQSQWATSSCRNTDLGRQLVSTIASCSPID